MRDRIDGTYFASSGPRLGILGRAAERLGFRLDAPLDDNSTGVELVESVEFDHESLWRLESEVCVHALLRNSADCDQSVDLGVVLEVGEAHALLALNAVQLKLHCVEG